MPHPLKTLIRLISTTSHATPKTCKTCGRMITWRKKWEKNWAEILYCSTTCRAQKPKPNSLDIQFESAILDLLKGRREQMRTSMNVKGIKEYITCEEAEGLALGRQQKTKDDSFRLKGGEGGEGGEGSSLGESRGVEKNTRERCRRAARRLVDRGIVEIMQGGKVVDGSFAKGVMEVRLKR